MKIAICDDSKEYAEIISDIIKRVMLKNGFNCSVSIYCLGRELLSAFKEEGFDIIFLDMEMPGLNGIETGLMIRSISKETVIFYLTSYKDYAYESYAVRARDYLLKPVKADKVEKVLLEFINERDSPEEFLDVRDKDGIVHRIPVNEITHILRKKEDRKIHIYCLDKKEITIVQTLENMEKKLMGGCFVKSSKSCLININNVRIVRKSVIYFSNEESEMASRRCLPELINRLKLKKSEVRV